jgi:hypothetical protein
MHDLMIPGSILAAWPTLSPSARSVAVALAAFLEEGWRCPDQESLGIRAGIGKRQTVARAVGELCARGILRASRRGNMGIFYAWRMPPNAEVAQCTPEGYIERDANGPFMGTLEAAPGFRDPGLINDLLAELEKDSN